MAASALAVAFLFWLIYGFDGLQGGPDWSFLPAANASLNAISASAVAFGLWCIRTGRKREHGYAMSAALFASALFLVGYITHHSLNGDTRFVTLGWLRPTYFFILISHIILSIVALPMVLTTAWFAIARNWSAHRAIARWTYPVWLYVSVTGVVVFFFLRHLNG